MLLTLKNTNILRFVEKIHERSSTLHCNAAKGVEMKRHYCFKPIKVALVLLQNYLSCVKTS
jgi:hypothetical protein